MRVFDNYADFYDLFYEDKDYNAEVNFIIDLAKINTNSQIKSVLDIGCGTGGHLIPFAKKGLKLTGFDLSETMINQAREKIKKANINAEISVNDVRTYRDGKKYDIIVAMFAVMGYLTSNDDFFKSLKTARIHLNENGLFIFDVWFGPAVLHEMPETRIQEFEKDGFRIIRLVRPEVDVVKQIVTVNYKILKLEGKKVLEEVKETHRMRYFFIQEMKFFLENADLKLVKVCPFMDSSKQPKIDDWNITVISKNI